MEESETEARSDLKIRKSDVRTQVFLMMTRNARVSACDADNDRLSAPMAARRRLSAWLTVFFSAGGWFDRAAILRHFSLCLAAILAYFPRHELQAGPQVLWIIAVAALLNLLTFVFAERPRIGALSRLLSPVFGVAGWTVLIHLTGGMYSPFLIGYGLEILLAARTFHSWGSGLVTGAVLAGLWGQEALLGIHGTSSRLLVQTGVFIGIGVVTAFLVRHWMREQKTVHLHASELHGRLQALEGELEVMRKLGGENVGRLAHGMKNAVHALGGFTDLIAKRLGDEPNGARALAGLRTAIAQLEALTRMTLGGPCGECVGASENAITPVDVVSVGDSVRTVVHELSAAYPAVVVKFDSGEPLPAVDVPTAAQHEVLLELCRNAAEAMGGRGEIDIEVNAQEGTLRLQVRDHGCGISRRDCEKLFSAGHTTKPGGSGLGLFLAQRLLRSHQGSLTYKPAVGGGSVFLVELPLRGSSPLTKDLPREVSA